jgi:hypothetical protein
MQEPTKTRAKASEGRLARAGLALAAWSEHWFPDPAVIAFLSVVFVLGVLAGFPKSMFGSRFPALAGCAHRLANRTSWPEFRGALL